MVAYYWVAAILLIYVVLAWLVGSVLHLSGANLWVLRFGLWVIGLAGAAIFIWYRRRMQAPPAAAAGASAGEGSSDLDLLVREALNRLKNSKLGGAATLSTLPVIYVLGQPGSTKTTVIANSGLEPELLSGHVYQDNAIVPTRHANFWFTRQALFADVGGGLAANGAWWVRLVQKLQPGKLSSAFSKGGQAPRAAVVCFDCESLLKSGAEAASAAARNLNARLHEVSQQLGISFPVYVLFTKMDRVPFFAEYMNTFTREEATQVLGVTLPLRQSQAGVYAEEETARLTKAFDELFFNLADKRIELLAREHEADKLSGTYEFPREVRKLRTPLVQFLVDLGRPSQLTANPLLRGFYFTGVRAIMVEEGMAAPQPAAAATQAQGEGATKFFSFAQMQARAEAPAPARVASARKVPQWVFLTHLFNDVILKDRAGLGASGFSSKVSVLRRMLLGAAAALCLLLAIAFMVSFFGNRALESEVIRAGNALAGVSVAPGQLPAADDLKRLDTLRQHVQKLAEYKKDGAPLSLRWGLYAGDTIYPDARKIYFGRFRQMMFGSTQEGLLAHLQKLPAVPAPTDNYGSTYETLKAYLITTSNHDKSSTQFLTPVLMNRWLAGRELDAERNALARNQFDFYATELTAENPYASENDGAAVERARRYLSQFAASERIYRSMLDEGNSKNPPIRFNKQFPGSAEAVIDNKEVEGAFSKNGFAFMQDAIAHSDRFFAGEEWVLGPQNLGSFDRAALEQELRKRYRTEFTEQWRAFLKAGTVLRYGGPNDAANKLSLLSGNQSPLLALLWLASSNTAVSDTEVANTFQPVQSVVAPGADRYIGPGNQPYMTGLAALQASVEQLAKSPAGMNDQMAVTQVRSAAAGAMQAAKQIEQGFRPDRVAQVDVTTAALLQAPIRAAENILRAPGLEGGAVRALCAQFAPVTNKFPFNAQSRTPATLAEVNALFQPGAGALWQFYEQNLKSLVLRQGSEYVVNPASGAKISPVFMGFFNRAAAFTETVYPANSPRPNLAYRMRPYPVEGIQGPTLDVNGQTLTAPAAPKQFTWDGGDMAAVHVSGRLGGSDITFLNYAGPWAVFQFFAEADRWQTQGNISTVEWTPRSGASGQPMMIGGKPLTLRYDVEMAGAPVFSKGFLGGLRCNVAAAK